MRLRVGRRDGGPVQEFNWHIAGLTRDDLLVHLCETLLSHYDSDDIHLWPNQRYDAGSVPDLVELTGGDGARLLAYDIDDLLRDTGFRRIDRAPPACGTRDDERPD